MLGPLRRPIRPLLPPRAPRDICGRCTTQCYRKSTAVNVGCRENIILEGYLTVGNKCEWTLKQVKILVGLKSREPPCPGEAVRGKGHKIRGHKTETDLDWDRLYCLRYVLNHVQSSLISGAKILGHFALSSQVNDNLDSSTLTDTFPLTSP